MEIRDLVAYVDDELGDEDRRRVEAELAEDPAALEMLADLCFQRFAIADVLRSEAAPGTLHRSAQPVRRVWPAALALAAGVMALLGAGVVLMKEWKGGEGGRVVARVVEVSDQLPVISDRLGKRVRAEVGAKVREGMRIETGEGGRVKFRYEGDPASPLSPGLRRGTGATEVEIGEHSTCNIQHSTFNGGKGLFLGKGRLTATVAKQSVSGGFVVETPQAKVEVKGTRFSVGVEDPESEISNLKSPISSTRLQVEEGRVRFTKLADGQAIDVKAGQYAIAGVGMELVAKAIPGSATTPAVVAGNYPKPGTHPDGKILFEDDFSRDSFNRNWEVVCYAPGSGFEAVTGNAERYLEFGEKTLNDGMTHSYLRFTVPAEEANVSGTWLGIRSRHSIKADRFVIEAHIMWCGLGSIQYNSGVEHEADIVPVYSSPMKIPAAPHAYRWEFIPGKDALLDDRLSRKFNLPNNVLQDGVLLGKQSVWHMKRDVVIKVFTIDSRDRKILFANTGTPRGFPHCLERFEIYRVKVRELVEDADSRDSTERR